MPEITDAELVTELERLISRDNSLDAMYGDTVVLRLFMYDNRDRLLALLHKGLEGNACLGRILNRCYAYAESDKLGLLVSIRQDAETTLKEWGDDR